MKNLFLLLTSLLLTTNIFAQEQTGLVREQNSNKRVIANVQITFEDAIPTTSDDNGVFTLFFSGKKEGDLIFYEEIRKSGYEIVNEKELEVLKIGRTNQLGTDLILAKAGLVDAAKKEYYEVSDDALIAGFNKEKQALRAKLQATQLGQEEYLNQLATLQEQYDIQKQSLDALAAKFARINFDDVAPIYQEALTLFKAGKVSEAITTLESANPAEQTKKIVAEEKRLTGAQKELDAQKAALATEKKKQIATVRLLADMYNVNFDPGKAEDQYDQLLLLDSSNLEILQEAADFYREQHRYEKAKNLYPKIIAHPAAEDWQVANAYGHLGELYTTTGNLASALTAYALAFENYEALHREKSSSYYKNGLAISYEKLGDTHSSLGNLGEALQYFEDETELFEELYESYPDNVSFKNGLAISYSKLGDTHSSLGNLGEALKYFEERSRLGKELYESYPDNVSFKNGLAISYSKLGDTHSSLGNLGEALKYFEDDLKLTKELYESYPDNVSFKNGLAISYEKLGATHSSLGNLGEALKYFEERSRLGKELYESYPDNVSFKNGLAISYEKLGSTHSSLGDLGKALKYFEDDLKLTKELYESYPDNVSFKNGLAISYSKLGATHSSLGNLGEALKYFEDQTELFEELYESYPDNVSFKNGLAVSYSKLGSTHSSLGNLGEALKYFEERSRLGKELYASYPDNVIFKSGLAISYSKLGETHSSLGNLGEALKYFEDCLKLTKELYASYPDNVGFKNDLAISYVKLATIYLETDLQKAKIYLVEAEKHFLELHRVSPLSAQVKQYLDIVQSVLKQLWPNLEEDFISQINNQIRLETDTLKLYQLYDNLCDELRPKAKYSNEYATDLAQALNSRAWYGFFLQEFEQAEQAIREGMALGTDNKYLATNLAPALLLQGKYEEARVAYLEYKDQAFGEQGLATYRNAFLDDLRAFEVAGIIPPERIEDVNKIRSILKK